MIKDINEMIIGRYFYGYSHGELTGDVVEDSLVGVWVDSWHDKLLPEIDCWEHEEIV